jgi:glutathione peroxidase
MTVLDVDVRALDGGPASLRDHAGKVLLIVNVASQCGLTPQYAGLEQLHEKFAERGFAVLGFPCNQFGEQEPGTPEEIATFCSTTYGVTFPIFEKIEVNGSGQHPLYAELTRLADGSGQAGDIRWNFEKFLIDRSGTPVHRFSPLVEPDADELVSAIDELLAG